MPPQPTLNSYPAETLSGSRVFATEFSCGPEPDSRGLDSDHVVSSAAREGRG